MSENVNFADDALPLVIPEGIRYNCQGCGRCCSGWAVGLTNEDYDRIKDVDWGSLHPDLSGRELFVHREAEYKAGMSLYPHGTKPRADGVCSFLIDNLCFIHSTFGEETKPGMCKLFPYTYVATPSGIYVGVVYNSMAAVRNMGELLSDQREYLEQTWKLVVAQDLAQGLANEQEAKVALSINKNTLSAVKFDINLVAGVPLSWTEYTAVEARMLEALKPEQTANIFETFLHLSDILTEALRLKNSGQDLAELNKFTPNIGRWYKESPGVFENLVFNLLAFRNFSWPQMRKDYAANWAESNRSAFTDPKVINSALKTIFRAQIDLVGAGTISLNAAKKFKIAPLSSEIDAFFRRFLYMKIFSKTFCGSSLGGLSVVAGCNNLAANFLSALTVAKAYAMSRKETELRIADLYESYFLMEKETVTFAQLTKERAQFYDTGFSSTRLFSRLLGQYSLSVGK